MATSLADQLGALNTPAPFAGAPSTQTQVQESLDFFMNPNSEYMRQARQSGMNTAAQRGGLNSSIAAGASQREAIGVANGLSQQALALQSDRDNVMNQEWLATQNFGRAMSSIPYANSMSMLNTIMQYGLEDPQLYTPSVLSGLQNFFQGNMNDTLARYFGR